MNSKMKRLIPVVLSAIVLTGVNVGQSQPPDISEVMERVGERVKQHYIDLKKLAWTDTIREQELNPDQTPKDKAREFAYDMIIRLQEIDEKIAPFVVREVSDLRVADGKPVRKGTSSKSTDPRAASVGSVAILMPGPRARYGFSYGGDADLDGRKTLLIDVTFPPSTRVPQVQWNDTFRLFGVSRNFELTGVSYDKARLWVDAETFDVLRNEVRSTPFEFSRNEKGKKITFEMATTFRFKRMSFENPHESLVVPESIEILRTFKGAKGGGVRTLHAFTDYKRFTGETRIESLEGLFRSR
jgi:hypothetical protein